MPLKSSIDRPDWDSPEACADFFSRIDPENYLAHAIREIESIVFEFHKSHSYSVHVYKTSDADIPDKIAFYERCCVIRVNPHDTKPEIFRLCLAHELGHLVYNIKSLQDPEVLKEPRDIPVGEEVYAWIFAYKLIKNKSDEYAELGIHKEFQWTDAKLKETILLLTDGNKEVNQGISKQFNKKL